MASLVNINANFKEYTLRIKQQGQKLFIKGDPDLCQGGLSFKALQKQVHEEDEGFLVQLYQISVVDNEEQPIPPEV